MFNKIKSIARDAIWLTIGTIATLCYVSYKAGKSIKDDVPEMMDFAKDTYGQVKDVLSKSATDANAPKAEDFESYEEFERAVVDSGVGIDELRKAQ
mgnify:CR=1 FL=1